ncbi:MAG TPA: hypothetical protein VES01_04095 [Dermatophilaceae bacterium]|nr:hypothetical protein [Dermatophilaceae bacterium]
MTGSNRTRGAQRNDLGGRLTRLPRTVGGVLRRWATAGSGASPPRIEDCPGDAVGPVTISYQPFEDDRPDPGEVVQARAGRYWVDIGTGGWDPRGRASEVRVDRVIRLAACRVRRIGARLPRDRFDHVAAAVTQRR